MITLEIDGKPHSIHWEYKNIHRVLEGIGEVDSVGTTIKLKDENHDTIKEATVIAYYKDRDDRSQARKFSLAKLVKDFPKEKRKIFWNAYQNRGHKSNTDLIIRGLTDEQVARIESLINEFSDSSEA